VKSKQKHILQNVGTNNSHDNFKKINIFFRQTEDNKQRTWFTVNVPSTDKRIISILCDSFFDKKRPPTMSCDSSIRI
jgi:hypothetical protein